MPRSDEDLLHLEEVLWLLVSPAGQGIDDFAFAKGLGPRTARFHRARSVE